MTETRTYAGSCHCGNVRFQATMELTSAMACNCSMCQRKGSLLTFIPAAQFKVIEEKQPLVPYLFNKKVIHHLFCPVCGMHPFARGTGRDGNPVVAVNVRCLEDVDLGVLKITEYDGRKV